MDSIILTDSCCDLTTDYVDYNKKYLDIIGMGVNIEGYEYYDDFGKTFSHDKFYDKLRNGIMPSTSQINIYRFMNIFEKHYKLGNEVLYLGFSSGMSGTFYNSVMAREEFLNEYPDAKITVIDTNSASIGQGVLIVKAVELLKSGKSITEIVAWIENNKSNSNHWFVVDDLHYLKKGGRISATAAAVGSALNVKPILVLDNQGRLKQYCNVRGRKKSIKLLSEKLANHIIDPENSTVIIGHGNCADDAELLRAAICKNCNPKEIIMSELSSTIASHVGPNMLSVAFIGNSNRL